MATKVGDEARKVGAHAIRSKPNHVRYDEARQVGANAMCKLVITEDTAIAARGDYKCFYPLLFASLGYKAFIV